MNFDRSRVAVLAASEASLTLAETVISAGELTEICFLLDAGDKATIQLLPVAEGLALTRVADFSNVDACTAAVRALDPDAVVTFSDHLCGLATHLDSALRGVNSVDPPWGRKDVQRRVLFEAGASAVRSARVTDESALRLFATQVGYPVVVKPTDGVASRDTWILRGETDLREFIAHGHEGDCRTAGMFAEEFIGSGPPLPGQLADYVSAEVFTADLPSRAAGHGSAFVTDRLPLAWPCRETGLMLPSALPDEVTRLVLDRAGRALDALRAGRGVFHVEVKPRPPDPEVIEVNGRLGGFIARLARYGANADLGRLALACYLGRAEPMALDWRRAVVVLLFQPPPLAARVTQAPSRREVARLPGVIAVDEIAAAGDPVDWRLGTNRAAAKIWMAASDRPDLLRLLGDAAVFLTEKFVFTDDVGRRVTEMPWVNKLVESTTGAWK
ncbi:MAG: hypothetical protein J2P27_00190 [Actinobacteria bacterium]|nr:hypothetical protein [Actinomycetota bacterium]